jgi:hypothetical protein
MPFVAEMVEPDAASESGSTVRVPGLNEIE